MSSNEMMNIGFAIEDFFRKSGFIKEFFQGRLISDWKKIVGDLIAENTKIVKLEGTILTIKVENSVWKNELYFRKKEIINMINNRYNMLLISDIILK